MGRLSTALSVLITKQLEHMSRRKVGIPKTLREKINVYW
jgi:hypothetical protein